MVSHGKVSDAGEVFRNTRREDLNGVELARTIRRTEYGFKFGK
jgi:hypothetical protein